MTRTIDFYFDFPSPYSYLAHTQLPGSRLSMAQRSLIIRFAYSSS
jgi:2-hydroxychromene-2-carboxylate isomerase